MPTKAGPGVMTKLAESSDLGVRRNRTLGLIIFQQWVGTCELGQAAFSARMRVGGR